MGKRKSSKKPQAKVGPQPLDKTFKCLFCQHPGTVMCKMLDSRPCSFKECHHTAS